MTLSDLQKLFPITGKNSASTGRIPIDFYLMFRDEISQICRENRKRVIFRGPRRRHASDTLKADAVAVVLYCRN